MTTVAVSLTLETKEEASPDVETLVGKTVMSLVADRATPEFVDLALVGWPAMDVATEEKLGITKPELVVLASLIKVAGFEVSLEIDEMIPEGFTAVLTPLLSGAVEETEPAVRGLVDSTTLSLTAELLGSNLGVVALAVTPMTDEVLEGIADATISPVIDVAVVSSRLCELEALVFDPPTVEICEKDDEGWLAETQVALDPGERLVETPAPVTDDIPERAGADHKALILTIAEVIFVGMKVAVGTCESETSELAEPLPTALSVGSWEVEDEGQLPREVYVSEVKLDPVLLELRADKLIDVSVVLAGASLGFETEEAVSNRTAN